MTGLKSIQKTVVESRNKVTDTNEYPIELNAEHAWTLSMAYVEEKTGREFIKEDGTLGFTRQDIAELLSTIPAISAIVVPFCTAAIVVSINCVVFPAFLFALQLLFYPYAFVVYREHSKKYSTLLVQLFAR